LEDYLDAAFDAVLQTGAPRDIFLTTDDPEVIEKIEKGEHDPWNFTYYYTR
jgi:hypothetical protein